ncbi:MULTISPECIES: ABC transporter permease [unclassified Nocardia]|uniref:ABC transporter permease n=1 Tax=unclassified Nocardia TaxID=2637762 RepID=UPI0027E0E9DA|nr:MULTISPECIES: ABC transporter permease [unclassified Nocardia]
MNTVEATMDHAASGEIDRRALLPDAGPQSERALRTWAVHSLIQCKRLLIGWSRDPATTIQTLAYPGFALLMFNIVLSHAIKNATGLPAVYGQVPMSTLIAAMAGSMVSALGFKGEKMTGLLGRFWTMPTHRAAGLTGRLLAEMVRVLITTLFVILVGLLIGFRFDQGPLAALGLICIPVLFGLGFAVFVTAIATVTEGILVVSIIGNVTTLLMFFNTGFVPVGAYPIWLQTTVANQPMSCAVEAMRGLSYGGPVAEPLLKTLAWTLGLIVIFGYPAVRGYQRAAQTGA